MNIISVIGARPQFIKAAVVARAFQQHQHQIKHRLIHTGQHYDSNMSEVFFSELDIPLPDFQLHIGGGSHGENTGRMIEAIEHVLIDEKPDGLLVYGDTDSTLAGTLAAVKMHIPIAHVEAGLRSFNRRMPEEINRVLTDHAANLLFAPTQLAVENLRREGICGTNVKFVGDVMYDATLFYSDRARKPLSISLENGQSFYLCTIHRAENTDDSNRLLSIVSIINRLAEQAIVVLPIHPRTLACVKRLEGKGFSPSVQVISPVGYLEMTWLLANCLMVLTDSGGLQKEAYFHHKTCITLREETEWVELVNIGANVLVGADSKRFFRAVSESYFPEDAQNLYGDGTSGMRIVSTFLDFL